MRRAVLAAAAVVVLAGPTALAFYSGGFFAQPRLIAGIVVWLLVLALAIAGRTPLPRGRAGWLALGGLAAITAWSALSITWAPLLGAASDNVQRLLLYVGALMLAIGVLRDRRALRAAEPVLALGVAVVIGYGLAGRLLPGILHLAHSLRAGGRLEQPITYWNSEGALAAVGLVLCARLAGDRSRPAAMRVLAAAGAAPLGAGVYLSYSRGAIAAAVVGLVVLVAAAPVRAQARAVATTLVAAAVAAALSSAFVGVASLSGPLGDRERDGAIVLGLMVVVAVLAALLSAHQIRGEARGGAPDALLPGARWRLPAAAATLGLVVAGLVYGGLQERSGGATALAGANADRLTSVSSNRYAYWRVGAHAFRRHPLDGLGSGGFRVFWLRERPFRESVQEVHSLELEMAVELGIVGLLAFGLMLSGFALAARSTLRRNPMLAAGPCAAAIVWLLHASIDWDWELPAVTLPAIVLVGLLVVAAEADPAAASELSSGTCGSEAVPAGAAAGAGRPTAS